MNRLIGIMAILVVLFLTVNRWLPLSALWHGPIESAPKDCHIKGNISLGGERIYHVPDGEWYAETRIDVLKGEHWFCSEEEARSAGWRKSYK